MKYITDVKVQVCVHSKASCLTCDDVEGQVQCRDLPMHHFSCLALVVMKGSTPVCLPNFAQASPCATRARHSGGGRGGGAKWSV